VARVRGALPNEAQDPVVAKIEADAQAIIWLAFSSDRQSPLEITDYADRVVADQLKTLPGVASVIIGGQRRYAMRLWLDPSRTSPRRKNDDLSDHFDEASSKWSRLTVILLSNEPDLMRVSTPSGANGDWHEPCSYPCTSPARRNRYDRTRTRKIAGYQPEGRCPGS